MENTTLSSEKNLCSCVHHRTLPILIMIFGGLFLLLRFSILTEEFVNLAWPLIVIAAGATQFTGRKCRCC